ncbi:glycosyltransferase family 9 protein [Pseudofulvibacter geojedonensis]|uniref:Glycosyltransferase family 9 protein n=1 Tax=Pseudofulvibacter geojedonensis TaxID=1123758 RepID=A0ABW3I4A1_9FLAO
MKAQFKHILVIRLSAMGDVAMTVPVLKAFTQQHPEVKVTVLTRAFYGVFFNDIPNVKVFSPELKGKHKGFLGLRRLSKELSKLDIDAVADLHDVLRSNILIRFLKLKGIPYQQIHKGRADKKALTRPDNKVLKPLQTTHERYADVFRLLGFSLDLSELILKQKGAINIPFLESFKGNKLIGIAPFAAHKGKMFPLDRMEKVVAKLAQESNTSILLFGGGKEERLLLDNITEKFNNVINVVSKFSFEEELGLISNLDVMISMDSGNGHLAAMYGVPVITVWGVTHPYAGFVPFNQPEKNQVLPDLELYPKIPTSIYGNKYPEIYITCFDTIKVATIVERCLTLLN